MSTKDSLTSPVLPALVAASFAGMSAFCLYHVISPSVDAVSTPAQTAMAAFALAFVAIGCLVWAGANLVIRALE